MVLGVRGRLTRSGLGSRENGGAFLHCWPKIQILTIRKLSEGKQSNIPLVDVSAFKKAAKEKVGDQDALPF